MQEIVGQGRGEGDFVPFVNAMPTRAQLERLGEFRLVKGIMKAGGFTVVAQKLGLRLPRRPNGFWENAANLDEASSQPG